MAVTGPMGTETVPNHHINIIITEEIYFVNMLGLLFFSISTATNKHHEIRHAQNAFWAFNCSNK